MTITGTKKLPYILEVYMSAQSCEAKEHYARLERAPWRGWLMTSEDGDAIGYFATEDEAREAVEEKFKDLTGEITISR